MFLSSTSIPTDVYPRVLIVVPSYRERWRPIKLREDIQIYRGVARHINISRRGKLVHTW